MARRNLTGEDQVARVFRAVSREAAQALTVALNKGVDEIADRARQLAPEGDADMTHMRETIAVQPARASARKRGGIVATVTAGFTDDTEDAAFRSEFGRAASSDGHPGHDAQPFMFPSYWSLRRRARARIARAMRAAVREAARRG